MSNLLLKCKGHLKPFIPTTYFEYTNLIMIIYYDNHTCKHGVYVSNRIYIAARVGEESKN